MPLALLLSPDDQAVSAITAVLEEMGVSCERPLDGASAAKQLNSHRFDLVLVDCENLPAAKLIFDVCRRGKSGSNPVPIAIVDGRAGLPTAFRLGAELVLTKPVAKDQARSTIRTAVSRVKKEEPARPVQPADPNSASDAAQENSLQASTVETEALLTKYETSSVPADNASPEPRALAATAAAVSSPIPHSFSAAPSPAPEPAESTFSAAPKPAASALSAAAPAADTSHASKLAPLVTEPKPVLVMKPSDDPVLAEAEKADVAPEAPIFSSYPPKQRKGRGPLVALLVLAIAAGGFYAAWVYQPGFQALVQPQIDRALALVENLRQSHNSAPAQAPAATAQRPSPASSPEAAQPVETAPVNAPAGVPETAASATPPSSGPAAPSVQPATSATDTTTLDKSGATATGVNKMAASPTAANQSSPAPSNPTTGTLGGELPGEETAVILSSKGAERRLAHSVQPMYPAEARSRGAEGTIVLKVVIDESGKVAGARLVEGDATLSKAAISAVKQWRYRPYVRNGKAQPFQTIVLMDFQRP